MTWSIASYSQTPASNTLINGTNIGVNCPPSDVGVFMRQIMADLATFTQATDGSTYPILFGRLLKRTVLSTPGTSTFTPQALTTAVFVRVVGGGGAGGGTPVTSGSQVAAGAGGAAGGYADKYITSGFSGVTVTVGSGGVGAVGAPGGNGGTSSFGALISATGGNGGQLNPAQVPSNTIVGGTAGGVGSSGDINAQGGPGLGAFYGATPNSGSGGQSYYGGGAFPVGGTTGGVAAVSPGSGGSGASTLQGNVTTIGGGAGKSGIVEIWEYA